MSDIIKVLKSKRCKQCNSKLEINKGTFDNSTYNIRCNKCNTSFRLWHNEISVKTIEQDGIRRISIRDNTEDPIKVSFINNVDYCKETMPINPRAYI